MLPSCSRGFEDGDGAGSIEILEFKNQLLIAEKYKKKQPTRFCQLAVNEKYGVRSFNLKKITRREF
jgi:hypothetical protein